MRASSDQSGEVRHVNQVQRANFVGNLAHAREIDEPRIGAAAADDQLWPLALSDLLQIVVINGLGFLGHAVGNDLVGLAGKIQWMAVRQMPAVREVQSENGVSRFDD